MQISRSGYYEYLHRKQSNRSIENEVLSERIKDIFQHHKGRYGAIRITQVLQNEGIIINRKRVARLMRNMELFARGANFTYKRYNKKSHQTARKNLINQVFKETQKNRVWVGDITYIPTKRGFLYLAAFVDLFTRKVTGWAMSTRIDVHLTMDAFLQAFGRERPSPGLIVHTDQGSQFTSGHFMMLLREHGAVLSNSRKGNPYDNALMESFFRTLKRELVNGAQYMDQEQARQDIFKYIELYYNTERMHSSLGYVSPKQFEFQNS